MQRSLYATNQLYFSQLEETCSKLSKSKVEHCINVFIANIEQAGMKIVLDSFRMLRTYFNDTSCPIFLCNKDGRTNNNQTFLV